MREKLIVLLEIRSAEIGDLTAITEIYNQAIVNTTATFDTEPKTAAEQAAWFEKHGAKHPVFVAVSLGVVIGWASLTEWSDRCAYSETAEVSVYVAPEHQGKGIGRELLGSLDTAARKLGYHTLISRIAGDSGASTRLHESFGFASIGVMREVGFKFGKRLDVLLMQKIY